ncbi:MAG: hypothetical protein ACLQPH_12100 [Acidimicrobiales bacterium]
MHPDAAVGTDAEGQVGVGGTVLADNTLFITASGAERLTHLSYGPVHERA